MLYFAFIETPLGRLIALEKEGALLYLGRDEAPPAGATEAWTPLLLRLRQELSEYFEGSRQAFDIPLDPGGTAWRRKCWEGLVSIPYGETRTYGWLASYAGNPRGARAAGGACHANPILLLIPCHRVIGADGSLTGFGAGMGMKERLLELERANAAR